MSQVQKIKFNQLVKQIREYEDDTQYLKVALFEDFVEKINKFVSDNEIDIEDFEFEDPLHYSSTAKTINQNGLKALLNHIELIEALINADTRSDLVSSNSDKYKEQKDKVFIVHGRDELTRSDVELLLHRIDVEPIILSFQANQGLTLIDKFEKYADVRYAIVLLTPDDFGGLEGTNTTNLRARQNVIFELGYFYGKLGRSNVCIIMKSDIEVPSDIQGIVYTRFVNKLDEIKSEIYRELTAAKVKFTPSF